MKLKKVILTVLIGASLVTAAQSATAAPTIPKSFLETTDYGNDNWEDIRETQSLQYNMGYIENADDYDWYSYTNKTNKVQKVETYLYVPYGYDYDLLLGNWRPREAEAAGSYRYDTVIIRPGDTVTRGVSGWNKNKFSSTENYVFWVVATPL